MLTFYPLGKKVLSRAAAVAEQEGWRWGKCDAYAVIIPSLLSSIWCDNPSGGEKKSTRHKESYSDAFFVLFHTSHPPTNVKPPSRYFSYRDCNRMGSRTKLLQQKLTFSLSRNRCCWSLLLRVFLSLVLIRNDFTFFGDVLRRSLSVSTLLLSSLVWGVSWWYRQCAT